MRVEEGSVEWEKTKRLAIEPWGTPTFKELAKEKEPMTRDRNAAKIKLEEAPWKSSATETKERENFKESMFNSIKCFWATI